MTQKISLFILLLLVACGGSAVNDSANQTHPVEPTVIQGGNVFGEPDLFSFLLKVWYPGTAQSYFTHPNVSDSWDCETSGTMTADGVLTIEDSGWNGQIVYTFNNCNFADTSINSGAITLSFDGIKYLGEGELQINGGSTGSVRVEGDWELDTWIFFNRFTIEASL